MLADIRLYQLISPTLPVGGFTYSQGLEWTVEAGWVHDRDSLSQWLNGLLRHSIATLELPVLLRLMQSLADASPADFRHWCQYLNASRETLELRREERQRGAALSRLLPRLGIEIPPELRDATAATQLAGIALAASNWRIEPPKACLGYAWSWLENIVMAGVKLVPLGQTHGQQILLELGTDLPAVVASATEATDSDIVSATPAVAIASSRHENQYTRLFRS